MTDPRLNAIGRFSASTEMSPRQVLEKPELLALPPKLTRVYLTDLGNVPEDGIVQAAIRLHDAGLVPVPHMAARRYDSLAAFDRRLRRLVGEAGVREVLAIAGETDTPGPLSSSVDMLETGLFDELGIERIAIAGHPEGAPEIPEATIRAFLMRKHELASQSDAHFHIVTQFGFDPHRVNLWLDEIAAWGNRFPVHIGVAGPAKITTLLKYAAFAGVENSLAFLKKRGGAVVSMLSGYDPETMIAPLEARIRTRPQCQLEQIHVYPFGGMQKTARWLLERGSWSFHAPHTRPNSIEVAQ
ncbi:methylenetetrahydrofolate reductase [Stappia taiwanensis]|uniref:Methylenetetrahydrofolate reductase n=1 Tax=Stappia taiwanensis TaxID=992267 RepID=A0A838XLM3_9HYPH|nr:methylenetetrahydrofolate reductase [Stappia taiwanensis]MBA4611012.1 methylenetetrahydrofolate reductase [Stappia taiwanensis]GGE94097.1 methylenetetrahydrofolate reductase [Stappia taiwanensis]